MHFISHAVRDIADRLARVLDPHLCGHRVHYDDEMDKIAEKWPKLKEINDGNSNPVPDESVALDYPLGVMIDQFVQKHRERRKRPSNYELLFRILMRNEPTSAHVNRRLATEFKEMREWFMHHTHLSQEVKSPVPESELQNNFSKFETMLHSFVGDFYTGTAELDEILHQANE
jgi:hypothetical protein